MRFLSIAVLAAAAVIANPKTPCTKKHTTKCSTICEDYVNSCGQTYGGCFCYGDPIPTFTDPGCPSSSSSLAAPASASFTESICADYINSCGMWYGGCYGICPGLTTPSFSVPACPSSWSSSISRYPPSSSSSIAPASITSCPYISKDYFDDCGNTYGPGCFSSCSGQPEPSYTISSCSASATSTYN